MASLALTPRFTAFGTPQNCQVGSRLFFDKTVQDVILESGCVVILVCFSGFFTGWVPSILLEARERQRRDAKRWKETRLKVFTSTSMIGLVTSPVTCQCGQSWVVQKHHKEIGKLRKVQRKAGFDVRGLRILRHLTRRDGLEPMFLISFDATCWLIGFIQDVTLERGGVSMLSGLIFCGPIAVAIIEGTRK